MSDLRDSLVQSGTLIGYLNTIVYAHNYNDLTNKPQINGVTLQGNKTASEIGLVTPATEAVQSVNGETGAVVLDGNDIAYNASYTVSAKIAAVEGAIPAIPVTSVNGETGDVVLDGSDIRYDANYTVSAKIAAVEGAIPVVPVQSVNGETGAVVLDGDDIEYSAGVTVNDKIDAVEAAIPVVSYPVTSVNTKTGAVVLDGDDIEYSEGVSVNTQINTLMDYIPVYGNTASGAIATFDTSLALPLQDCTIDINAVQEGSGTPSPSNVRNIVGFTGANIHVADDENPHIIDNVTSITWNDEAGTVYGGSLRITQGFTKLVDDKMDIALDNLSWTYQDGYFYSNAVSGIKTPVDSQAMDGICTCLTARSLHSLMTKQTNYVFAGSSSRRIYVYIQGITTEADLLTALSGQILVCYKAIPIEYTLANIPPIYTLNGTNNIFGDTNGNTSVMYACSLKDYIDGQ